MSSRQEKAAEQEQDRAALVCLTCKSGKRQCDKRLPICSRCKKLDRLCEYRTASQPGPVTRSIQPGLFMDRVWPNACLRCKEHKRRCDRIIPKCSRCLRIGSSCTYRSASPQSPVIVTGNTEADTYGVQLMNFAPLAQAEVELTFEPPIRCRSYMSHLIQFFLTSIALPSDIVMACSLAHHLRSQWMRHAMSDPCLFHATLFSASASIEILGGQHNTARTLYHQTWAIHLINERLAQAEPVLNYGTLGAVITLLCYNMVALDRDSAVAHQKGLENMLLATSKSFRADIRPLIAIVKVAMLSFACIYDVLPIWDCLSSESVRPNTILRNVVSRATFGNDESYFEKETTDAILDVYEAMSRLDHLVHADRCSISVEVERALSFATTSSWTHRAEYNHHLTLPERLNVCCQICCQLFWKMLRRQSRSQQTPNTTGNNEVQQLLKHLSQIEPSYWIRNAPEVFTWAAFTGAAVSEHQDACVAFIIKAGTILTAIDDEELTLIRQGWRCFRLLKRLGGDDKPLAILGNGGYELTSERDVT